jgi:hypothetical protein
MGIYSRLDTDAPPPHNAPTAGELPVIPLLDWRTSGKRTSGGRDQGLPVSPPANEQAAFWPTWIHFD